MTKQEKIQEAYGEHWDKVKDFVEENGWLHDKNVSGEEPFFENLYSYGEYWRPGDLIGIKNNNGWIKIESEADLPRDEGIYYTISKKNQTYVRIDFYYFGQEYGSDKRFWINNLTHYQSIIKPKPPIY